MANKSKFVHVSYIRAKPAKIWAALTSPKIAPRCWFGVKPISSWKKGAPWKLVFKSGLVADRGTILAAKKPKRLVIKWRNDFIPAMKAEGFTRCTIEIAQEKSTAKLTVTHVMGRPNSKFIGAVSGGWPMILSSLKTMLETGKPLKFKRMGRK